MAKIRMPKQCYKQYSKHPRAIIEGNKFMTDSQQPFGHFSNSQGAEQLAQHQLITLESSSNKKSQFSDLVGAVMASSAAAVSFPLRHRNLDQRPGSHLGKRGASEISKLSRSLGMHQNAQDNADFLGSVALSSAGQVQATMMNAAFTPVDSQHQIQKQSFGGHSNTQKGQSKSEHRRVPCKARGMGDSHTSSTAYFDIPRNLKHGAILACSHPGCAASGRRFRYCQVCEVPVAKRNFQKRHSHGLIPAGDPILVASQNANRASESILEANDDEDSEESNKHHRSVSYDAADTLNQLCSKRKRDQKTSEKALKLDTCVENRQDMHAQLNAIESRWLKLLYDRPSADDKEAMEQWMTSILNTAEAAKKTDSQTLTPPLSKHDSINIEVAPEDSVFGCENNDVITSIQDHQRAIKSQTVNSERQIDPLENGQFSSHSCGNQSPVVMMEKSSQSNIRTDSNHSNGNEENNEDEQPEAVTPTQYDDNGKILRTGSGNLLGGKGGLQRNNQASNSTDNLEKDVDAFPADAMVEKSDEAADQKSTTSRQSSTLQDEQSQQSSVTTRPGQWRRRSVQDARKLMGLIKLSGLKEDHFDDMFDR